MSTALLKTTKDKHPKRKRKAQGKQIQEIGEPTPPQETTTTPSTRGGSGGRRGAGRGRPRPSRRTPYQYQQMETMIDEIIERIEQRRGGRSPKPRRPPPGDAPIALEVSRSDSGFSTLRQATPRAVTKQSDNCINHYNHNPPNSNHYCNHYLIQVIPQK